MINLSNEPLKTEEARRWFYDEVDISNLEGYRIMRNYPEACEQIHREWMKQEGLKIPSKNQLPSFLNKWVEICTSNPKKPIMVSLLGIAGIITILFTSSR